MGLLGAIGGEIIGSRAALGLFLIEFCPWEEDIPVIRCFVLVVVVMPFVAF